MAGKNSRREPRIELDLTVTLQLPDGKQTYKVGDASYRGVFLLSKNPLPLRKLVRLETQLPGGDQPLEMMGLVAHHLSPAEAQEMNRDPGMGIHLFSVGEETHRRWREFIQSQYERDPEAHEQFKRLELPHVVAHLPDHKALSEYFDDDFAAGEMFVRSSEVHDEQSTVICDIVHSDASESIDLEGTVVEAVKSPPRKRGMRIAFDPLRDDDKRRIQAFVDGNFDQLDRRWTDESTEAVEA